MVAASVFAIHNHYLSNEERNVSTSDGQTGGLDGTGAIDEERLFLLPGVAEESTTVLYDSTMTCPVVSPSSTEQG